MAHHGLPLKHKRAKQHQHPIDKIVYFFAFATPAFELPQLVTIYSNHSAKNVSVVTWGFFAVASFTWLLYALHRKLKPMIIAYILFTVIESTIFAGILYYS
jgi:uncharacterized protein with PQ loop repeat